MTYLDVGDLRIVWSIDTEPIAAHSIDVRGPLINKRDVVTRTSKIRTDTSPVGSGAEHGDAGARIGHQRARPARFWVRC